MKTSQTTAGHVTFVRLLHGTPNDGGKSVIKTRGFSACHAMLHVPAISSDHAQRPYHALSASVTYVRRKRLMYVESTRKKTDKAPIRGEMVPVSDRLIAATSGEQGFSTSLSTDYPRKNFAPLVEHGFGQVYNAKNNFPR